MTTHYINITLLPDPEFSHAHLLGALVAKLHRALVQGQTTDIGVSYPQHVSQPLTKRTLGAVLRLHGTPEALQPYSRALYILLMQLSRRRQEELLADPKEG